VSHLHIPDGVLPAWLWAGGLAIALVLLALSARAGSAARPSSVAYQGALGGVVLLAMALEIPLGPIEYHLSLVGPVGVLLGAAGAFQAMFVACAILAFAGHGGFTVVGLNALVLGAGASLARPLYRALSTRWSAAASLAGATALAQAVSGLAWLAVLELALGAMPAGRSPGRLALLSAFALPLWAVGIATETAVAYGLARFLARVRPDLLPAPASGAKERT
jgi:cobalt/nickel transport system permease protein